MHPSQVIAALIPNGVGWVMPCVCVNDHETSKVPPTPPRTHKHTHVRTAAVQVCSIPPFYSHNNARRDCGLLYLPPASE